MSPKWDARLIIIWVKEWAFMVTFSILELTSSLALLSNRSLSYSSCSFLFLSSALSYNYRKYCKSPNSDTCRIAVTNLKFEQCGYNIRATSWENLFLPINEQQRYRSTCASAQSDQHLCCLLPRYYYISCFYIRNFKTLASFWRQIFSWRGSYSNGFKRSR